MALNEAEKALAIKLKNDGVPPEQIKQQVLDARMSLGAQKSAIQTTQSALSAATPSSLKGALGMKDITPMLKTTEGKQKAQGLLSGIMQSPQQISGQIESKIPQEYLPKEQKQGIVSGIMQTPQQIGQYAQQEVGLKTEQGQQKAQDFEKLKQLSQNQGILNQQSQQEYQQIKSKYGIPENVNLTPNQIDQIKTQPMPQGVSYTQQEQSRYSELVNKPQNQLTPQEQQELQYFKTKQAVVGQKIQGAEIMTPQTQEAKQQDIMTQQQLPAEQRSIAGQQAVTGEAQENIRQDKIRQAQQKKVKDRTPEENRMIKEENLTNFEAEIANTPQEKLVNMDPKLLPERSFESVYGRKRNPDEEILHDIAMRAKGMELDESSRIGGVVRSLESTRETANEKMDKAMAEFEGGSPLLGAVYLARAMVDTIEAPATGLIGLGDREMKQSIQNVMSTYDKHTPEKVKTFLRSRKDDVNQLAKDNPLLAQSLMLAGELFGGVAAAKAAKTVGQGAKAAVKAGVSEAGDISQKSIRLARQLAATIKKNAPDSVEMATKAVGKATTKIKKAGQEALETTGKKIAPITKAVGEISESAGKMLKRGADEKRLKEIQDILTPDKSKKAFMQQQGKTAEGLLGRKYTPSKSEVEVFKEVAKIPEIKQKGVFANKTSLQNMNIIEDAISKEAKQLDSKLAGYKFNIDENDFAVMKKEMYKQAEEALSKDMTTAGKRATNKFLQILKNEAKDGNITGETFKKSRVKFDNWVTDKHPNLYKGTQSDLKDAITSVRNVANEFLANKAPNANVKESLLKQSRLYRAKDTLLEKAYSEGDNALERLINVAEKNKLFRDGFWGRGIGSTGVLAGRVVRSPFRAIAKLIPSRGTIGDGLEKLGSMLKNKMEIMPSKKVEIQGAIKEVKNIIKMLPEADQPKLLTAGKPMLTQGKEVKLLASGQKTIPSTNQVKQITTTKPNIPNSKSPIQSKSTTKSLVSKEIPKELYPLADALKKNKVKRFSIGGTDDDLVYRMEFEDGKIGGWSAKFLEKKYNIKSLEEFKDLYSKVHPSSKLTKIAESKAIPEDIKKLTNTLKGMKEDYKKTTSNIVRKDLEKSMYEIKKKLTEKGYSFDGLPIKK